MTVRLIALYKKPDDEVAFMQHYHEVHVPLVMKTPHLLKADICRVTGAPFGEPAYFLVAQMHFPDRKSFDQAMASDENRAAGKDLMSFARGLVTLMIAE